uniref:Ubiquinol-cytochrome C reductase hinge domain-containing protein n=1 Tax=Timema cristinae TaxID=61476 RepID=A0A7R9GPM8_TIMCR|nr:unnamed protein product [Timema cristinae]
MLFSDKAILGPSKVIMSTSPKSFIPTVKAQDAEEEPELVDPQEVLRAECGGQKSCLTLEEKYKACNDRVNSRKKTAEICSEELFDYLHCVDGCVSKRQYGLRCSQHRGYPEVAPRHTWITNTFIVYRWCNRSAPPALPLGP